MTTYGDCNTAEDASLDADTETLVGDLTIPSGKGGTIKKILLAYANIVDAKAATGYCELKLGSHAGPFRFPFGVGAGGATSSSHGKAEEIDVDISVFANETVKIYMTANETLVNVHAGIIWVA